MRECLVTRLGLYTIAESQTPSKTRGGFVCVYHTELGSGNKTSTNQESLLCHRSHLVWGARFLMMVGLFLLFRSSCSHRQFELNLSAMYTHITYQCTVVCVCGSDEQWSCSWFVISNYLYQCNMSSHLPHSMVEIPLWFCGQCFRTSYPSWK